MDTADIIIATEKISSGILNIRFSGETNVWFTGTRNAETADDATRTNQTGNNAKNALQLSNVGGNGRITMKNIITAEPYTAKRFLKEAIVVFGTFSIWAFTLAFIDDMIRLGVL